MAAPRSDHRGSTPRRTTARFELFDSSDPPSIGKYALLIDVTC
jgi:hypothetical protein